jgi:predicted 2-oxoglutarate/Fe(II)-dependent dioxygenase YbiX
MLKASFFSRLGMLTVENFLDDEACARLRRAARRATTVEAHVWKNGEKIVDEDARRATQAKVGQEVEAFVESRLLELCPRVERHFDVKLRGLQPLQFLIYRPGDFFECHSDNDPDSEAPSYLRERKVSVVIFLNGKRRADGATTSTGGGLTFPGLIDDPRLSSYGFQVEAETGLLIAFRSSLAHAVSPVLRGERYRIVSWYVE